MLINRSPKCRGRPDELVQAPLKPSEQRTHAVFALTHSNIAQIMSDLWCKQEDSRSRCCWEGRFSGSCRSVHRAGSRGTAGRSGRRWAHTPGSGPRGPASAVKRTLFQPALEREENTGFGDVKSNRQQSRNRQNLTAVWGRSAPGAVAQAHGGAEAPQLEARITTKRDARPGVMEHALCGSVHRHWRPEASHH